MEGGTFPFTIFCDLFPFEHSVSSEIEISIKLRYLMYNEEILNNFETF